MLLSAPPAFFQHKPQQQLSVFGTLVIKSQCVFGAVDFGVNCSFNQFYTVCSSTCRHGFLGEELGYCAR